MKKIISYINILLLALLCGNSCTDYLNIPVEADKTDEDIFGNYYNFQGYVDQLYTYVPRYIMITMDGSFGGETVSTTGWATGYNSVRGNYYQFMTRGYLTTDATFGKGVWHGWEAIRIANIGLKNFDMLKGTDEEKAKIKGQLLFFRAFCHQEILCAWGAIPYIDKVLENDLEQSRFIEYNGKQGYQACAERIAEDLTEAAKLLPVAWDNDLANRGRCTAVAALAYKARALVYAASPLMSEYSGMSVLDRKPATVNKDLMRRAAEAASQAIKMSEDNSSHYGLVPWENYSNMFYTTDGTMPLTSETLWANYFDQKGNGNILNLLGRIHLPHNAIFGGNAVNTTPTQNYVDLFEMADGTLYKAELHDNDNAKRWDFRDPRFRKAVYVDRDFAGRHAKTQLAYYTEDNNNKAGATRAADNCQTPYCIHKYWPVGANKTDNGTEYTNMRMCTPLMRLAEVYLIYAEAINEYYGNPNQKIDAEWATNLTGLEAVNKVRQRAGHVATTATGGTHGSFRKMILNERAVEMCFENSFWYDIRRYKVGEELNQESILTLDFHKDWTNFRRRELLKRTFETPKHYWMPFPSHLTQMYEGFPQNEGWQ